MNSTADALFVGIDIGTSGVRALAIDADAAAVCRQFAATAHVFSSDSGWRSFGRDA